MLLSVGWQGSKRIHGCLMHLDIIDGKVWIQRDGTEEGIAAEVRGLADGAGISLEEAVLCQARAEAGQVPEGGCPAFVVTGEATVDHNSLAGQNQDLEPEYADIAMLLRVRPNDGRPAAIMFTFAGQLGYCGLNEYGLAHFAKALSTNYAPAL